MQRVVRSLWPRLLAPIIPLSFGLVARTPALAPTPMLLNRPNLYNYQ